MGEANGPPASCRDQQDPASSLQYWRRPCRQSLRSYPTTLQNLLFCVLISFPLVRSPSSDRDMLELLSFAAVETVERGARNRGDLGVRKETGIMIKLLHTIETNVSDVVTDEVKIIRNHRNPAISKRKATIHCHFKSSPLDILRHDVSSGRVQCLCHKVRELTGMGDAGADHLGRLIRQHILYRLLQDGRGAA